MKISGPNIFFVFLLLCISTNVANAQSKQKNGDLAVGKFDINVAKIRGAHTYRQTRLGDVLNRTIPQALADANGIKIEAIDRITGTFQTPKNLETASGLSIGINEIPFEFSIRIEFANADAMAKLKTNVESFFRKADDLEGVKYLVPPAGPKNIRCVFRDHKTIEFGTIAFLNNSNKNLTSNRLNGLWEQLPKDDAIRLCVDIASAQGLFDEVLESGKAIAPQEAAFVFETASKMKSLSLAFDIESKTMLTLITNGANSESGTSLGQGLDRILGKVKLSAVELVEESEMPNSFKPVLKEILSSINVSVKGKIVSINIPKPAGLAEAISSSNTGARH